MTFGNFFMHPLSVLRHSDRWFGDFPRSLNAARGRVLLLPSFCKLFPVRQLCVCGLSQCQQFSDQLDSVSDQLDSVSDQLDSVSDQLDSVSDQLDSVSGASEFQWTWQKVGHAAASGMNALLRRCHVLRVGAWRGEWAVLTQQPLTVIVTHLVLCGKFWSHILQKYQHQNRKDKSGHEV